MWRVVPRSRIRVLTLLASGACVALASCAGAPLVHEPLDPEFQRGVALGFVDATADGVAPGAAPGTLGAVIGEVRTLGASDVSILVPLETEGIDGRTVARDSLDDVSLRRAIITARSRGLHVMVFPIVRLRARLPGEWRGKLRPADRAAWFDDYTRELEAIALVCEQAGAERLVIGSELVSFEDDAASWHALALRVRRLYRGKLVYSANWDRYHDVKFWDAVDEIGISAYFTLAPRGSDPSVAELRDAWRPIVASLAVFSARTRRPIVFTEVGFPSVSGAAFWPWNDHQLQRVCATGEGCEGATSMESQRRLWAAFVSVFSDRASTRFLAGVYVWLWAGQGGLRDRGYTPRGKPAEAVVKLWYGGGRARPVPRL